MKDKATQPNWEITIQLQKGNSKRKANVKIPFNTRWSQGYINCSIMQKDDGELWVCMESKEYNGRKLYPYFFENLPAISEAVINAYQKLVKDDNVEGF